ncbi:hypothetical protein E1B28_000076 [Marasmius oreades]|uniref:Uncharacterized protein n=1 Tax=Marasmius oreades TaxID=181124 RepID=A0A9P7V0P7_9AGAR|nr:uncharacterized protein E1B28_000076 [Marasmius oreades]KAG7098102.1 hypothetical protein E1B28_000076 [Marasmius oreades]
MSISGIASTITLPRESSGIQNRWNLELAVFAIAETCVTEPGQRLPDLITIRLLSGELTALDFLKSQVSSSLDRSSIMSRLNSVCGRTVTSTYSLCTTCCHTLVRFEVFASFPYRSISNIQYPRFRLSHSSIHQSDILIQRIFKLQSRVVRILGAERASAIESG